MLFRQSVLVYGRGSSFVHFRLTDNPLRQCGALSRGISKGMHLQLVLNTEMRGSCRLSGCQASYRRRFKDCSVWLLWSVALSRKQSSRAAIFTPYLPPFSLSVSRALVFIPSTSHSISISCRSSFCFLISKDVDIVELPGIPRGFLKR